MWHPKILYTKAHSDNKYMKIPSSWSIRAFSWEMSAKGGSAET